MSSASTALLIHDENRVVPCLLCRTSWEERLVGVSLRNEEQVLGNLCPRCLTYSPRENAVWLQRYIEEFRLAIADWNGTLQNQVRLSQSQGDYRAEILKVIQSTARIQRMTALLRKGTRELKNQFSRTRRVLNQLRQQACASSTEKLSPLLSGEFSRVDQLLSIAPHLLKLEKWQTTVEDLMDTERDMLVQKFVLDLREVEALVERRYRGFLRAE